MGPFRGRGGPLCLPGVPQGQYCSLSCAVGGETELQINTNRCLMAMLISKTTTTTFITMSAFHHAYKQMSDQLTWHITYCRFSLLKLDSHPITIARSVETISMI